MECSAAPYGTILRSSAFTCIPRSPKLTPYLDLPRRLEGFPGFCPEVPESVAEKAEDGFWKSRLEASCIGGLRIDGSGGSYRHLRLPPFMRCIPSSRRYDTTQRADEQPDCCRYGTTAYQRDIKLISSLSGGVLLRKYLSAVLGRCRICDVPNAGYAPGIIYSNLALRLRSTLASTTNQSVPIPLPSRTTAEGWMVSCFLLVILDWRVESSFLPL